MQNIIQSSTTFNRYKKTKSASLFCNCSQTLVKVFTRWIYSILLAVFICSQPAQADFLTEGGIDSFLGEPRFELKETLFKGDRFPNLVVTNAGTLVATWARREVQIRRSEDGGATWLPVELLGAGRHGGGATFDYKTRRILLFIEETHPPLVPQTEMVGTRKFTSKDDGITWELEDFIIKPDINGFVPSMHMSEKGITLVHGQHAGRLVRPARVYNEKLGYNTALFSDDGGVTWIPSTPFPDELGTGEGAIVELSDGRLFYSSRKHFFHYMDESRFTSHRYYALSHDGGETWEDLGANLELPDGPRFRGHTGRGHNYNGHFGLLAGLTRLPVAGHDILIFSNVDTEGHQRERGSVWASFDGGKTWPVKRLVYDGPFSYSSLAAGKPGTPSEGWIFVQFEGGPDGPHSDGNIARFNLTWLLQGELTGAGELPEALQDIRQQVMANAAAGRMNSSRNEEFSEQILFRQGDFGYHTFRIPALIQAPDGSLLAIAEGRKNGWRDNGEIHTIVRRSEDGGQTWGPLQVIWQDGENTCGNPTVLVDAIKERVWVFMTHNLGQDTFRQIARGESAGGRTIWSSYSDDNGLSWSTPRKHPELQPSNVRWDATGPGNGIQVREGPYAGRLIVPANSRNLYSDDHGETWHETAWLPAGTSEATIVEIANGALIRNSRATGTLRDHRRRIVNQSNDGGATWTAFRPHPQLTCPVCQASIVSHWDPSSRQRMLVFANPADYLDDGSASHDRRLNMTVRLSMSDGEKFEYTRRIFEGDSAYSSVASLDDGAIALLYENGDGWPYHRINFARFSIGWVKQEP